MSEKARRKRLMRLRGEKRVKKDKLKGLPPGVTPLFRPAELFTNAYASRGEKRVKKEKLKGLSSDITPIFRFAEAAANRFKYRDPMSIIAEHDRWSQRLEESKDGSEPDRAEAEPARNEDTIAGVELEEGEVQSRAGDNAPLAEEGTTQGEPADDQS